MEEYTTGESPENKKYKAQAKYDAKAAKYYSLKLNKKTDSDLIEQLEKVPNIQKYIKGLIADDLERKRVKMFNITWLKDMYWKSGEKKTYTAEELEDLGESPADYVELYDADDKTLLAYCDDAAGWDSPCVVEILNYLADKYGAKVEDSDSAEDVFNKVKAAFEANNS